MNGTLLKTIEELLRQVSNQRQQIEMLKEMLAQVTHDKAKETAGEP